MSKEFDWTDIPEISGFGGGYEALCRKMVEAGVKWLRAHYPSDAEFGDSTKNGRFPVQRIKEACAEGFDDCSVAQVDTAYNHAGFIWRYGWEKYRQQSIEKRARD